MGKDLVSLRAATRICGVGRETLNRWISEAGARLKRAAGEKWIERSELARCLQGRGLPVPVDFELWPRVLIVDDEDDLRLTIERLISRWWSVAEIRAAADAERALKILENYRPDLAVVDVNLPGKDGLNLCREISLNPELAHTRLLVISGSHAIKINERAFAEGAAEFLPKPFEPEALRAAAQRLLGASL